MSSLRDDMDRARAKVREQRLTRDALGTTRGLVMIRRRKEETPKLAVVIRSLDGDTARIWYADAPLSELLIMREVVEARFATRAEVADVIAELGRAGREAWWTIDPSKTIQKAPSGTT